LTHDKFINARRGRDENRLDPGYNEWTLVRDHLDAWRAAGAERVTARQGVEAVLDDGTWQLQARLASAFWSARGECVRYTLRLLGRGIPVSSDYPQAVRVTIPPFLRPRVRAVRVLQGNTVLPVETQTEDGFWLMLTTRAPELYCEFELEQAA
jgi:hypothetical protein